MEVCFISEYVLTKVTWSLLWGY